MQFPYRVCKILHHQSFSIWKRIPFLFNMSAEGRIRNKALNVLHNHTRKVIKLRRQLMEADSIDLTPKEDECGLKQRHAFLDSLLIAQKENGYLTDANIQEEVDTFMFEVNFFFFFFLLCLK